MSCIHYQGHSAVEKIKNFEAKLARQQEQQSRLQKRSDKLHTKGFNSPPGFDQINAELGTHVQPTDFDEYLVNMNQDDGVDYDDYMKRVLSEQQSVPAPAPKRAPPSRPAPRMNFSSQNYNIPDDDGSSAGFTNQSTQQQYRSQSYTPSKSFVPNPLFSSGNTSSSGGGKIMGLLERKLAGRSAVNSLAPPGPTSLRRGISQEQFHENGGDGNQSSKTYQQQRQQQYDYSPSNAAKTNGHPVAFFDDYSENSGSFGWHGMSH